VVDTTQFNNTNILDGSVGTNGVVSFNIGANASQTVDVDFANFALGSSTATSDEQTLALTIGDINGVTAASSIVMTEADGSSIVINDAAIVAAQLLTGGTGTDLQDTDYATFTQALNTQIAANTGMNQVAFAVGSADISILGTRANEGVGGITTMVQKTAAGVESAVSATATVGDTVGSAAVLGTQSLNLTLAQANGIAAGSSLVITDADGATFEVTDAAIVTAQGVTTGTGTTLQDTDYATLIQALNAQSTASTTFAGVAFAVGDAGDTITAIQDVAGTGTLLSMNSRTAAGAEAAVGTITTNAVGVAAGGADVMAADISDFLVEGTQAQATTTLDELDAAIAGLAGQRAEFGSWVNRLEHTVDNLTNVSQNTSASRSRIEDADYAVETSELARTQIISQAATAMLSQANQQAQSVLALLK
jgi:flagellin